MTLWRTSPALPYSRRCRTRTSRASRALRTASVSQAPVRDCAARSTPMNDCNAAMRAFGPFQRGDRYRPKAESRPAPLASPEAVVHLAQGLSHLPQW